MTSLPGDETTAKRYLAYLVQAAGVAAVLFGSAATLGWLDLAGYFTSRALSMSLIRPDPVALALRSPWVVVLIILLFWVWRGWYDTHRAWGRHPRIAWTVAAVAAAFGLYTYATSENYQGFVMVIGLICLAVYVGAPIGLTTPPRRLFVAAAILMLYVFFHGLAVGAEQISHPAERTPLAIVTTEPLTGLTPNDLPNGPFEYADLYFVHSDEGSLFVSSAASPKKTWVIPWSNVSSVVNGPFPGPSLTQ